MEQKNVHFPRVGVATIILKGHQKILLGLRRGSRSPGTWFPPAGHLEMHESFDACAIREVREETGLHIQEPRFLGVTNDPALDDGSHYVTIWMIAEWEHGEPSVTEPESCESWVWCDWDDLPTPLNRSFLHFRTGRARPIYVY